MYLRPVPDFIVIDDEPLPTVPAPRRTPEQRKRENAENWKRKTGQDIPVATPATAPEVIPETMDAREDDLAAVVVSKTLRSMAAGKLQPTLRDGLTAQQLLDRRAEKAADRRFMLQLSQALAGGGYAPPPKLLPSPDDTTIEGDFTEVDDSNLAPAHLRSEP